MKGKPLYPFAITAILGIGLIIILSFYGLNIDQNMAGDNDDGNEQEFSDPIELGEYLYGTTGCISCHGGDLAGVGSNPAVNALEGRLTVEEIVQIIEDGPGSMPGDLASGSDAEAIAEYLLSESE
ncbi:cytochrome c [Evansella sp. AB-P1]|uniref:c-type cytochrome n=1 Tax=Evansella sp. AB-P1 TaxID=3037653 RepID=UPI00241D50F4|nr:cytochrome c [Evansella sp. AB-P1]MDG5786564.1 cytochrome c [Evansella sp. AB-P1]